MLNIKNVLKERELSINECAKILGIPYATMHAIVSGNANIADCKYSTIKRISQFLGIPMEYIELEDNAFQIFRSNLHHDMKRDGEIATRNKILYDKLVDVHFLHGQNAKALYLLSLVEYIENHENLSHDAIVTKYASAMMSEPFYMGDKSSQNPDSYIPEFVHHNIMEGQLYDAV